MVGVRREEMDQPDVSIPQLLLVALAASVVVALVGYGSVSSAAFGTYNSGWDGTSDLRATAAGTGAQVSVVRQTETYSGVPPARTVGFVLSPTSTYDAQEMLRLREFVRRGGTLVVAADSGSSVDHLLRGVGASARVDGRPLRDVRANYRSPAMPVATPVANRTLVSGVESVTLNHGTVVEPHGATVLVNTSGYAYLDRNRNGTLDRSENLTSWPVATVERIGAGRVVTVSDSSVFINAMLERPGNRQFVRALVADRRNALVDVSHASRLPPVRAALWTVRESSPVQLGVGAALVGLLGVLSRRSGLGAKVRGLLSREADTPVENASVRREQLVAYLQRRHPEWERERVERVVSVLDGPGDERRSDDE